MYDYVVTEQFPGFQRGDVVPANKVDMVLAEYPSNVVRRIAVTPMPPEPKPGK